jgi:hypothetical protein
MPPESPDKSANVFLVTVKIEGEKGSATIACRGLQQDPLFPGKLVLMDVQGLSWPFQGHFVKVHQWSIDKDGVLNWMLGPLRDTFDISTDMLQGKSQDVPWPPGTLPNGQIVNHPDEIHKAVVKDPPPVKLSDKLPPVEPPPVEEPLTVASTLPGDETTAAEVQKKARKNRLK